MRKTELAIQICLIGVCAGFLGLLAYCIANRVGYPFELEWLEGDMMLAAVRLLEHKPLYTAPSWNYIPGIYPPFYYILAAGAFKLFGPGLPVLRCVSLCGLMGIFAILYAAVYRGSREHWLSFIAMGLFASFYNLHGSWYDTGRVDSMFFCLLLSGILLADLARASTLCAVSSAVVFSLAVFTKQSAGMYLPFISLFLFFNNRKASKAFTGTAAALCCAAFAYLHLTSDGWFTYHVITNPVTFPRNIHTSLLAEALILIKGFPIFLLLAAGGLILTLARCRRPAELTIWEITLIPSIVAFCRIRAITGSNVNDSMYVTVWLSMLLPLWFSRYVLSRAFSPRAYLSPLVAAMIAIQLVLLAYAPKKWLPEPGSAARGMELLSELRSAPGPVLVLRHPVYAWMAGKEPALHFGNFWAYNLTSPSYGAGDLAEKIRARYFSLVVIDDYDYGFFGERTVPVRKHYAVKRRIGYATDREFNMLSGYLTRPTDILVPKESGKEQPASGLGAGGSNPPGQDTF